MGMQKRPDVALKRIASQDKLRSRKLDNHDANDEMLLEFAAVGMIRGSLTVKADGQLRNSP